MRQSRKMGHLEHSAALADGPGQTGFADFKLIHNCLPNLALDDVRFDCTVAGMRLKHPLIINAITGGAADVTRVNENLARLALNTGAAMAVGSQYAAIEDRAVVNSYSVVRKVNPDGVFLANLGAHATIQDAKQAVEMIGANAIQIHLNIAQELVMTEGDRNFCGYLDNIAAICAALSVPVIVKEVGCGIAREQARALAAAGVAAIDVGGVGGTNFLAIEAARSTAILPEEFLGWGIPTAVSAVEVAGALSPGTGLIVSGGIRMALDAVKALAIGGQAVGVAGPIVKIISRQGLGAAQKWVEDFLKDMRFLMLMVGAASIADLERVPLIIVGESREWLTARGIDISLFANRQ